MGKKRLKSSIYPKNGFYNFAMHENPEPILNNLVFIQNWLRPALTPVLKNRDHKRLVEELTLLDQTIKATGLETKAITFALKGWEDAPSWQRNRRAEFAVYALRVELLRHMLGVPGFEAFSVTLASSDLLTDFCGCRSIAGIRWTSKSSLHRASTLFSDEQLRELNTLLVECAGSAPSAVRLGLEGPEDLSVCLIDTTCLEANIHFPVDWLLLRDVSTTLLKAIKLIRKEGLLNRMVDLPEELSKSMNRLCIEMTHSRGKPGAKKARKGILRKMKTLLKRIGRHALRHRDLLEKDYGQTELSQAQAGRIIARIDEKLEQLPKVIEQAHERIIGERQIANQDKILSAHEADIDVIVRGKAGASVEFGNELIIGESQSGLIVDYMLYGKGAPSEGKQLIESAQRQQKLTVDIKLSSVVTDRGFDGTKTVNWLKSESITSQICPKNPQALRERLKDMEFSRWQTRRGSTEARIAILKNHTTGRVWRAKGLTHRRLAVGWSVLTHNLIWIVRTVREQQQAPPAKAA